MRHHFLLMIIIIFKNKMPAGGTPSTHTFSKQVVVEYLNVWFRSTTPINEKRSIRNLSFYLSSNSFVISYRRRLTLCTALSTWSPRYTSSDLYLRCGSLASLAKRSFHFDPPKINGSNSKSVFALIG